MHPSRAIRGRRSQLLSGRRIVVGISGSIAAIEVPRILRELIRHGAEVRTVMSGEAARLVTPESIAFASGSPPLMQLSGQVEHVTWMGPGEEKADLYLIAPATANTISKIAHGIDDTPVTSFASVALGGDVPMLLAPAMHAHMAQNPAIQENLERLRRWGVGVIPAQSSEGEEKIATPEEVAAAVLHRLGDRAWRGRSVLVIGGAARESIDDVRSITNESSGATAVALATHAYFRGAEVELWASTLEVPIPSFLSVRRWRSVADLRALVRSRSAVLRRASAVLVPAAISDFTLPAARGKLSSKELPSLTLRLSKAPKILPELRRAVRPPALLVGFKLLARGTPSELETAGRELLREAGLDWVAANERASMGGPETRVVVVTKRGARRWLSGSKYEVAGKLLDDLGREITELGPDAGLAAAGRPGPRPKRRGG